MNILPTKSWVSSIEEMTFMGQLWCFWHYSLLKYMKGNKYNDLAQDENMDGKEMPTYHSWHCIFILYYHSYHIHTSHIECSFRRYDCGLSFTIHPQCSSIANKTWLKRAPQFFLIYSPHISLSFPLRLFFALPFFVVWFQTCSILAWYELDD